MTRTKTIRLRVSEAEAQTIAQKAAAELLTVSAYLRRLALDVAAPTQRAGSIQSPS